MPTYEYFCKGCEYYFEKILSIHEDSSVECCPLCEYTAFKVFNSAPYVISNPTHHAAERRQRRSYPFTDTDITGHPIEVRSPNEYAKLLDKHNLRPVETKGELGEYQTEKFAKLSEARRKGIDSKRIKLPERPKLDDPPALKEKKRKRAREIEKVAQAHLERIKNSLGTNTLATLPVA